MVDLEEVRRQLIGAWRVVRYDDRVSTDDAWSASYGDDVDGLVVYDESGWLSISVSGSGRYDSYFGRFAVLEVGAEEPDGIRGRIKQTVVASNMPGLETMDPTRPFRLSGDTLVLGDEVLWQRVCTRAAREGAV